MRDSHVLAHSSSARRSSDLRCRQFTQVGRMVTALARVGVLLGGPRAAGNDIRRADVGGGLGIPYDRSKAVPPLPSAYGEMVARVTRDWGVRLTFEPGRLIVGNAGVLVSRVIRVKQGETSSFIIVDAAMNDLIRPTLYEAWHDILAVEPRSEEHTSELQSLMRISYAVFC